MTDTTPSEVALPPLPPPDRSITVHPLPSQSLELSVYTDSTMQDYACDAVDRVLQALDLDPERYRTEGGAVNLARLRATLLHPEEYLPVTHWLVDAHK